MFIRCLDSMLEWFTHMGTRCYRIGTGVWHWRMALTPRFFAGDRSPCDKFMTNP